MIQKIGKYDVVREIGRGGMGIVYEARDSQIGRSVAIKVITTFYADDADLLKRFRQEAQATGKLQHKNIVTVHDYGEVDGIPYLVMEYLEGEGLDKIIVHKRTSDLIVQLNYITQVCEALGYAHQHDLVHRDVKPANVVVLQSGDIKLVDFGIVRVANEALSRPGQVIGTMYYLSPERVNGAEPDSRIDIWATGILMFELLTGCLPFKGKDTVSTLYSIVKDPVPSLSKFLTDYPPELDVILSRALAKETDERYQSADEFRWELLRVIDALVEERTRVFLTTAETYYEQRQWDRARENVQNALLVSKHYPRALELRWRIQRAIEQEKREQRAQELGEQGLGLAAAGDLSGALRLLEEALQCDKSREDLQAERQRISLEQERRQQIAERMQRAEQAREGGQLEQALAEVDRALEIDAKHAGAKQLRQALLQLIEQEQRRARLQQLSSAARTRMAIGEYDAALEMLLEARELAPESEEVARLTVTAEAAREQERQRRELQEHIAAVEEAMHAMEHGQACERARRGLQQFPDNAELQQLLQVAEEHRRAEEHRQRVQASVARAQKLMTGGEAEAALEELRRGAAAEPDEAFDSMITLVEAELRRRKEEKLRTETLKQAQAELRNKQYDRAITVLQAAMAQIHSADLETLLQFAQREKAAQQRAQAVQEASAHAQSLLKQARYEESSAFLSEILKDLPGKELQSLYDESRRLLEQHRTEVNASVSKIRALLEQGVFSEALRIAEKAPKSYRLVAEFNACRELAHARQSELRASLEKLKAAEQAMARAENFPGLDVAVAQLEEISPAIKASPEWQVKSQNWKAVHCKRVCELIQQSLERVNLLLRSAGEASVTEARSLLMDPQLDAAMGSICETEAGKDFRRTYSGLFQRLQSAEALLVVASATETTDRETGLQRLKVLERDSEQEVDVAKLLDMSRRATDIAKSHPSDEDIQHLATLILRNVTSRTTQIHMSMSGNVDYSQAVLTPLPALDEVEEPPQRESASPPASIVSAPGQALTRGMPEVPVFAPPPEEPPERPLRPTAMPRPAESSPEPYSRRPEVTKPSGRGKYILLGAAALLIGSSASWFVMHRPAAITKGEIISFDRRPAGATLMIDGEPAAGCADTCNVKLPAGHHTLVLEKPGYLPLSSPFEVAAHGASSPRHISLSLEPIPTPHTAAGAAAVPHIVHATLSITGAIPDSRVLLDGEQVGQTSRAPFTHDSFPIGSHTLSVVSRTDVLNLSIAVENNGTVELKAAEGMNEQVVLGISRAGTQATVYCRCKGAHFTVNGRPAKMLSSETYGYNERGKASENLALVLAGAPPLKIAPSREEQLTVILERLPTVEVHATPEASKPPEVATLETGSKRIEPAADAPPPSKAPYIPSAPLPSLGSMPSSPVVDPAAAEWNTLKSTQDTTALERFRSKYPNSPLAAAASERADNLSWESVKRSGPQDIESLQRFVNEHPTSAHLDEANAMIASLTAKARSTQSDDRAEVLQVLNTYKAAYEAKDLSRLAAVWPSISGNKQLQTTFQNAKSIKVTLLPDPPEINGEIATVTSSQNIQIATQGPAKSINSRVAFNLRKTQGKWAISSISVR